MPTISSPRVEAMAGRVRATAYYSRDQDAIEVLPDVCPVADSHRRAGEKEHRRDVAAHWPDMAWRDATRLKCTTVDQHGDRHWCPYWYGLAVSADATRRVDLSMLRTRVLESATQQTGCLVLCVGQQRNVPPGV